MQVQPVLNGLRASLESQRSLAGGDGAIDDAVAWLAEALGPALRIAAQAPESFVVHDPDQIWMALVHGVLVFLGSSSATSPWRHCGVTVMSW